MRVERKRGNDRERKREREVWAHPKRGSCSPEGGLKLTRNGACAQRKDREREREREREAGLTRSRFPALK